MRVGRLAQFFLFKIPSLRARARKQEGERVREGIAASFYVSKQLSKWRMVAFWEPFRRCTAKSLLASTERYAWWKYTFSYTPLPIITLFIPSTLSPITCSHCILSLPPISLHIPLLLLSPGQKSSLLSSFFLPLNKLRKFISPDTWDRWKLYVQTKTLTSFIFSAKALLHGK